MGYSFVPAAVPGLALLEGGGIPHPVGCGAVALRSGEILAGLGMNASEQVSEAEATRDAWRVLSDTCERDFFRAAGTLWVP